MSKTVSINPVRLYLDWLSKIPRVQAEFIAYTFWMLTTEDTADMIMTREEALRSFKFFLTRTDFPLRVLSRMLTVKEHTNLIVNNYDHFLAKDKVHEVLGGGVFKLSAKQWEKILSSWNELYSGYLSREVFNKWLRTIY